MSADASSPGSPPSVKSVAAAVAAAAAAAAGSSSAGTSTARPTHSHAPEGGFRDTIESILIAFILAFIFRTFVVEAFVIPTGSMAPTLLGTHARFTCDDCGYTFEANYSAPGGEDQNIRAVVPHDQFPPPKQGADPHTDCPNCGKVLHDAKQVDGNTPVQIHYGDRILVLKYAYLLQDPQRWDVVVFKSPDEPMPANSPWYVTNFIKRLVGRPNETVMILDGDVYVSPTAPQDPPPGSPDRSPILPNDFTIQTKPRHVQDALWRIVCDGDFVPRQGEWRPWVVEDGTGWDLGPELKQGRVFTFDDRGGGAAGTIRFDNVSNKARPFTDFLAYAQQDSDDHNVSDVKLTLTYRRTQGEGPLRLRLTKRDDTFTAEITPGLATLYRKRGPAAGPDDLGERVAFADKLGHLSEGAGPVQLDFINVDHVVTLRVGDVDVMSFAYDPDMAKMRTAYAAGDRKLPKAEVRISAAGQSCEVSHVSLWRDVYYLNSPSPPIKWGSPAKPMRLGPDEYFVLGDNTVISKDARYWEYSIDLDAEDLHVDAGRVPGRFLLGKAFFVYWPAGYRPFDSPKSPGLIPNFGDMRLIH